MINREHPINNGLRNHRITIPFLGFPGCLWSRTYGLEKCTEDDSWHEPSKTRPGIEVGVGMDTNSDEDGGFVDFIW